MVFTPHTRLVNPRLGTYFGIFASAFAGIVLIALMLESLGAGEVSVRAALLVLPVLLYAAFGLTVASSQPLDFFAGGRRIPAFFAGLSLAITALGGVWLVCLTGSLFHLGVDAFALSLGLVGGLVFMGVLIVPYMRKFGAFTVPGYLGQRLESRMVRVVAAAVLSIPVLLVLVAEIRVGAAVATRLIDGGETVMIALVVTAAALIVAGGGMRSLSWSSSAKAIAAILALVTPVTIVSVLVMNLPVPQMTQGNLLRSLARIEIARNVPELVAPALLVDLPGPGLEPLAKRFLQSFGGIGPSAFVLTLLSILAGIAGLPTLVARAGTTPSVYEARKSIGWAVVITAFIVLTLASIAVFLRSYVFEQVVGSPGDRLPAWFQQLQQLGIASVADKLRIADFAGIGFERDAALFALPIAAGLPQVFYLLALAGALAAALAATAAGLVTLGAILAEDVAHGLVAAPPAEAMRVRLARGGIVVAALLSAAVAMLRSDPLVLALAGLAISASASFPVLVLSVLWKRLNAWGAVAGMTAGFTAAVTAILLAESGLAGHTTPFAGMIGMPVAVVAMLIVTRLTPPVGRNVLEIVRDMRVPGGETLVDRNFRLERLRKAGAG